jgi:hypothetical protein
MAIVIQNTKILLQKFITTLVFKNFSEKIGKNRPLAEQ